MAMYLIGDIQGCDGALAQLLDTLAFSPSRDTVYVLGDLVNRGPDSAGVLRRLMGYGTSARCLLGNHDLHLLAVAHGARKTGRRDTLDALLAAADRHDLLHWLQQQPLALHESVGDTTLLMVHAGILPSWTAAQTLALAGEVQTVLRSDAAPAFFQAMYGNAPTAWSDQLAGVDRLRVIVNALTRLRFCTPAGDMEFAHSGGASDAPVGYLPWFDIQGRRTADCTVAFGHWSTLGPQGLGARQDVLALDTGCVWGGCLSALRVAPCNGAAPLATELVQVHCPQVQAPGD
ncbi:symmetrical bis(5'-nucleosyl)-tetraphosphatase [Rhodoferax sp.]|uniref:symmetrical bis(5'-nucleosyl)-tetraphosphatase n=1 Tax=Rhodoferax sp. TaxID=50421 RepID=UPI002ACD8C5D|nr:symmetrical bis(5'-nucleosyl)-tetraphosphatase [Rhodoferax sp.]MDZ7919837.1 symmetrical bis(5'-nucleosyl)-tetraphosphatase [Rhodoferax sp.]